MKRIAWMLTMVIMCGCHITEKKQKVIVTTKVDPINFQIPDQTKTSVTVTYECSW